MSRLARGSKKLRMTVQCLCLMWWTMALMVLATGITQGDVQVEAGISSGAHHQTAVVNDGFNGDDPQLLSSDNSMVLGRRSLLRSSGSFDDEGIVLAAGPAAAVIQYPAGADSDTSLTSSHTRVLLGKKDDDDEEDDDDDDEEEEEEGEEVSVDVKAIVGVHVKQFRAPKGLKTKNGGRLLRNEDGEMVMVETPVSRRFSKYVAKDKDFLKRIAYLGTVRRKELNAICRKVAKGRTNFKTDLNVNEAKGMEDTGDDITGAKVDHQFGCTITKGPRVKLNPKLKDGVVFALLELGTTNNLIDCQKGVKKCNMWQLLHDEDAEELTDLYSRRRQLLMMNSGSQFSERLPARGGVAKFMAEPTKTEPPNPATRHAIDAVKPGGAAAAPGPAPAPPAGKGGVAIQSAVLGSGKEEKPNDAKPTGSAPVVSPGKPGQASGGKLGSSDPAKAATQPKVETWENFATPEGRSGKSGAISGEQAQNNCDAEWISLYLKTIPFPVNDKADRKSQFWLDCMAIQTSTTLKPEDQDKEMKKLIAGIKASKEYATLLAEANYKRSTEKDPRKTKP